MHVEICHLTTNKGTDIKAIEELLDWTEVLHVPAGASAGTPEVISIR